MKAGKCRAVSLQNGHGASLVKFGSCQPRIFILARHYVRKTVKSGFVESLKFGFFILGLGEPCISSSRGYWLDTSKVYVFNNSLNSFRIATPSVCRFSDTRDCGAFITFANGCFDSSSSYLIPWSVREELRSELVAFVDRGHCLQCCALANA